MIVYIAPIVEGHAELRVELGYAVDGQSSQDGLSTLAPWTNRRLSRRVTSFDRSKSLPEELEEKR